MADDHLLHAQDAERLPKPLAHRIPLVGILDLLAIQTCPHDAVRAPAQQETWVRHPNVWCIPSIWLSAKIIWKAKGRTKAFLAPPCKFEDAIRPGCKNLRAWWQASGSGCREPWLTPWRRKAVVLVGPLARCHPSSMLLPQH